MNAVPQCGAWDKKWLTKGWHKEGWNRWKVGSGRRLGWRRTKWEGKKNEK